MPLRTDDHRRVLARAFIQESQTDDPAFPDDPRAVLQAVVVIEPRIPEAPDQVYRQLAGAEPDMIWPYVPAGRVDQRPAVRQKWDDIAFRSAWDAARATVDVAAIRAVRRRSFQRSIRILRNRQIERLAMLAHWVRAEYRYGSRAPRLDPDDDDDTFRVTRGSR